MKGSIRVSAKTVDDAITEALIQLGVTSDRLEYEVIEKGSPGFLGIGMKQAVIEAWKKEEPEPEEDIFNMDFLKEERVQSAEEKEEEKVQDEKKESKTENEVRKKEIKETKKDIRKEKKKERKKEPVHIEEAQQEGKREEIELAKVEDVTIRAVEKFIKDTLNAMDMDVEIRSEIDSDGALFVEMKGDHMGILIGKRGQTLDALQYLANRVANKHQEGYVRVKLDTENYRARREETLKHLAKNIAHKVKRTRRPVALEPMNPYERRIIHSALQSDPYVTTHSEGEEPYRKVVVTLKR